MFLALLPVGDVGHSTSLQLCGTADLLGCILVLLTVGNIEIVPLASSLAMKRRNGNHIIL